MQLTCFYSNKAPEFYKHKSEFDAWIDEVRLVGETEVQVEDDDVGVDGATSHVPAREPELAGASHDAALRRPTRGVVDALRRQCAAGVLAGAGGEDEDDGCGGGGAVQRRVHTEGLPPADEPRRRVRPFPERAVEHGHVAERRPVPASMDHIMSGTSAEVRGEAWRRECHRRRRTCGGWRLWRRCRWTRGSRSGGGSAPRRAADDGAGQQTATKRGVINQMI